MMRVPGADDMADVMERIIDRGIVVEPCTLIFLTEPGRTGRFHWILQSSVDNPVCEWDHAA